jgi:acetolactate synthase-1/2/3 large subunit
VAPTNCHWDPAPHAPALDAPLPTPRVSADTVEAIAELLANGKNTALLLGAQALRNEGLELAGRIAARTGAQLMSETFPSRLARGEGRVQVQLVPYFLEMAQPFFAQYEQIVLVGALPPVSTFAYQGSSTQKIPPACEVSAFASPDQDVLAALKDLAREVKAKRKVTPRQQRIEPKRPRGELTPKAIGQSVNLLMPENAILVDEGATAGLELYAETAGARPHDYLYSVPGAAIGNGLPVALGAAIACPDRKVVALQADGSAMYTNQALWTIAHEDCDITVVILKNDEYAILNVELARVREGDATAKMKSMLELNKPSIDWVSIARGMGVPAVAVATAGEFHTAFRKAMAKRGPMLIEATMAQDLQPVVDLIHQMRQAK